MQRLATGPGERGEAGRVVHDEEGNLRVTENGAAYYAGGLEVGQLILRVDGQPVDGLQHQDIARLIAESFARRDRPDIEFLVQEAKKSNLEPKPTALVFLEA
ncbi:unnamed protein product [Callosobruchus maculatus]|uniref:PDZ domain-containing protein n=1 Tax=Callosobruchus maculatus TaxID=64391 RepID=A0A653DU96_CALMS|nr:unnamed protein product [Callosobruchus maculatus]